MAKFKKGDRVRLTAVVFGGPELGSLGTVAEDGSSCPYVDWDGYRKGHDATFDDGRESVLSVGEEVIEAAPPAVDNRLITVLLAAGHVTQAQVDAARALLAMEA